MWPRAYVAASFVPLNHRPGHAQADIGEADAYVAGEKISFALMDLPLGMSLSYPAETAGAFCDGRCWPAFDFFRRAAIDLVR